MKRILFMLVVITSILTLSARTPQEMYEKGIEYEQKGKSERAMKWYQKAAENGYVTAQFEIAEYYYKGDRLVQDYNQAAYWYKKAAEQGHEQSQFNIAQCYAKGIGVAEVNEIQASKWYLQAAEQGHIEAQYIIAQRYKEGIGIAQNDARALSWYQKAAEQGIMDAQYYVATCFYKGNGGTTQDYAQAVHWYQKVAEHNPPHRNIVEIQYILGCCYREGKGVAQDDKQAITWYQKAAKGGNMEAQYYLATCYYKGEGGVSQDYAEAVKWYQKVTEHNIPHKNIVEIQYILGCCYKEGKGVAQDDKQALKWFHKVAEHGNIDVQYYLATCYYKGESGASQDYTEAVKWLQKLTEHTTPHRNIAEIQYVLGCCYFEGKGVEADINQADAWWRKADAQGHPTVKPYLNLKPAIEGDAQAQYDLAISLLKGVVFSQDSIQAIHWLQKAAGQGHTQAQYQLGECHHEGYGTHVYFTRSEEWWRKAAEQGDANAQYILGCYYDRNGFTEYRTEYGFLSKEDQLAMARKRKDKEQTVYWFQKAAEQGHMDAQYELAKIYYYEDKKYVRAVSLFHKLFNNHGNLFVMEQASSILAECYKYGYGVFRDPVKATYYKNKSIEMYKMLVESDL